MVHLEGVRQFPLPPGEVAPRLGDAAFLVGCLSQVDEVVEAGPDRATWKLRPPFSFVSGTLETTLDVVERSESGARYRLLSKGVGATAKVEAEVACEPEGAGTRVRWSADVTEMTGLLKWVPKGLITSSAGKVIEEVWQSVEAKLKP